MLFFVVRHPAAHWGQPALILLDKGEKGLYQNTM
jgi:hypothetical protein